MKNDDSEIKKAFGLNLRNARHAKGYSQEILANLCELDRTYIGGVERGERNVSLVNIVRIARALEIPPSDLMPVIGKRVRA